MASDRPSTEGLLFRWRGILAYDGTGYQGWQKQAHDRPTIQGALEAALEQIAGHPVPTIGASRTDTGVHAFGQVVHATTGVWRDLDRWQRPLNAVLPPAIRVVDWQEAEWGFHARHQTAGKTYCYDWSWGPPAFPLIAGVRPWHLATSPDPERLLEALAIIRVTTDWTSYTSEADPQKRSLTGLWLLTSPGRARMVIQGPGFHFQQVRRIAHAVAGAATGASSVQRLRELEEWPVRNAQEQPAPPGGLVLAAVHYDRAELGQLPDIAFAGWWQDPRSTEVKAL